MRQKDIESQSYRFSPHFRISWHRYRFLIYMTPIWFRKLFNTRDFGANFEFEKGINMYPHVLNCDVNLLFNVTINDISVIYVTAHRCAGGLKKMDLRSGSQRHRHFVGFFNVPVLAPTRTTLFLRWFRHTAPFSRLLRSRWGYGGHILDLTPRALTGVYLINCKFNFCTCMLN